MEIFDKKQAANETDSFDKCYAFVKKYGNNSNRISIVRMNFWWLYESKLNRCNSVEDCDRILKEHDRIIKIMNMNGLDDDRRRRKLAETRRKHLEARNKIVKTVRRD